MQWTVPFRPVLHPSIRSRRERTGALLMIESSCMGDEWISYDMLCMTIQFADHSHHKGDTRCSDCAGLGMT